MHKLGLNRDYLIFGFGYGNKVLFFVSILLVLFFFVGVFRTAKRTGWKLDFWHVTIGINYIIPYFVMYAFAAHPLNYLYIGHFLNKTSPIVDSVFLLHVFGYFMLLIGSCLYRLVTINSDKPIYFNFFDKIEYGYAALIKNSNAVKLLFVLALVFYLLLIAILIKGGGSIFNGREYFMENRVFNPIFIFALKVISLGGILTGIRYVDCPSKKRLILFLIFGIFSSISGTRSGILGMYLSTFFFWSYKNYYKVKFRFVFIFGIIALIGAVSVTVFRTGGNISEILGKFTELFYGNTFSDLRDSAWFFSGYDGKLLYGKNYFADIVAFIPSSLSSFRETFSYGFYTVRVAFGQIIKEHAGLRIGWFGEIFVNFGWFGVIVFGVLIGFVLRWVTDRIKYDIMQNNDVILAFTRTLFLGIIIGLGNSSGLFLNFYITLIEIFVLYVMVNIFETLFAKKI